MLRMLTVEDEPWISKGIEKMLPWQQYNIQIVGNARNGKIALDLIKLYKPDIIITDIRMPVMDGLSMLEQLNKEMTSYPKIIIISGYNDFDYAKRAIKYGVSNYILKPIDPEELKTTIENIKNQIERERQERENISIIQLKNYIYERISNREKHMDADVVFPCKYYLFIFSLVPISNEELKNIGRNFLLRMGSQHIYVVYEDSSEALINIIKTNIKQLQKRYPCGVSQIHEGEDLSVEHAYKEAIQNLKYYREDEKNVSNHVFLNIEDESKLLLALKQGEKRVFTQHLNEILDNNQTLEAHWFILFQLYIEISKYFNIDNRLDQNKAWLQEFKSISQWDDLYRWKAIFFDPLIDYILYKWDKYSKDYSLQVKIFIEQNYHNSSLSLDMVAEYLELSPSYLSWLFKKETGINFTSYIAKKRIEEAKKLLIQTKLNLYEISKAVGFNDVKYFIKVFKKEVSLTPIQFRELNR
ncbi:response regulator [Aeribacillus composti]|uniref:response regulator transcription factor n=1 Tax=Aeribacillus composti TaxID=1868734 RepID=UPI002E1E6160|nr:response regulator [Aeribacillus composti]